VKIIDQLKARSANEKFALFACGTRRQLLGVYDTPDAAWSAAGQTWVECVNGGEPRESLYFSVEITEAKS